MPKPKLLIHAVTDAQKMAALNVKPAVQRNNRFAAKRAGQNASRAWLAQRKVSHIEVADVQHIAKTGRLRTQIALGAPSGPTRYAANTGEIHRLRPRVLKLLKDAPENRGEVKTWRASV
jgi:hypothetical protein